MRTTNDLRVAAASEGRHVIASDAAAAFARRRGAALVGFCGLAGAGKTTAARHLERALGFERVRFAEPLKAMLRALGLTEAEVDGADKATPSALLGGKTPRQAMQWLGTEWGRALIDPDLWTRAWGIQADRVLDRGGCVVVDDVRFANEAAAIRARGGVIVHVLRDRDQAKPATHVSETIPFRWDIAIANERQDAFERKVACFAALERHERGRWAVLERMIDAFEGTS